MFQIERVLIFRPSTVYHSINKPTSLSFGRLAPACNLFLSKMNHWDGSRCVGQVLVKPHWVTRCDFFSDMLTMLKSPDSFHKSPFLLVNFPVLHWLNSLVPYFVFNILQIGLLFGLFSLHSMLDKKVLGDKSGLISWYLDLFLFCSQKSGNDWASLGILQAEDGLSDAPGSPRNYGVA